MPTLTSASLPIHYEVRGDGPPIMLVHGFSSSLEGNWGQSGWIDFLVREGRQVIGLDCRGHGSSGKPHDPAAYAGHQMPDDVISVLDELGLDQVDLMGYSMGGWITLNLLSRRAERFRSAVVGGAGLRTAAADPGRRAAIAAAMEAQDIASITDETALRMRRFAESRGNDLLALAAVQRADRGVPDEAALGRLALPVLVVVGDRDEAFGAARALSELVPNARLVVLPAEDHLSAVGAEGYRTAVAQFLSQVSPAPQAAAARAPGGPGGA